jgi:hypothetical protein
MLRRLVIVLALVLGMSGLTAVTTTAAASAGSCANSSVLHVWTEPWSGGQQQIRVIPSTAARIWQLSPAATNNIWHAVQQCVPGLYGSLADSIYMQIKCHVLGSHYGYPWAGGYSWDFETWRPYPVGWDVAFATKCNWGGDPYLPL